MKDIDKFKVTCDESPCLKKSKNVYTLTHELPIFCSAEQARACKCIIPNHIPDYAIYMGEGIFEWIETNAI